MANDYNFNLEEAAHHFKYWPKRISMPWPLQPTWEKQWIFELLKSE